MTKVYFVRHAEPNYNNHDDLTRELTEKGLWDREKVTEFLADKEIDVVMSSPFKRAYDTVKHFADSCGETILVVDDFRERKIDNVWIPDFNSFCERQWQDLCGAHPALHPPGHAGLLGSISPGTLQPLHGAHYPTFQKKAGRNQLATTQCLSSLGLAAPKPCAGSRWSSDSSSFQGPRGLPASYSRWG